MPSSQRKNRIRLAEAVSAMTGFPTEAVSSEPVLLCKGPWEMVVEGCQAILEYSGVRIRLDMKKEKLTVEGTELTMSDFHRNSLTIRGQIGTVRWEV